MEEQGIGRPSTYAPTVSTILDREYVVKEGKYLRTSPPWAGWSTSLMKDSGSRDIVDLKFTAHMEQKLDDVEDGQGELEGPCSGSSTATSHENLETGGEGSGGRPYQGP